MARCTFCEDSIETASAYNKVKIAKDSIFGWSIAIKNISCPLYSECSAKEAVKSNTTYMQIHFCPYCGRELRE